MGELTGTTFAGFEVGDAIGRDLVSTIYGAVDTETDDDRRVALRVVAEDLCATEGPDRELYARFLQRTGAALTFEHAHAPQIEEVGEHRGRGYVISPRVDTVGFATYLDEHAPLDVEPALALFAQVADVLDAGHRAGLTHGAVNPSTLQVIAPGDDGVPEVRLTGFGIGALLELRLRRDGKHLREVDELLYVAPEQLRQQSVTGRADQYAMACALVHSLTGAPPFVRNSVGGLFGAHLFVSPALGGGSPSDGVILKALAKEPRDRYATCGQMIADVSRAERSAANRDRAAKRRRETPAHDWNDDRDAMAPEATSAARKTAISAVGVDEPRVDGAAAPSPQADVVPTAPAREGTAVSNGAGSAVAGVRADAAPVEDSSTGGDGDAEMAYPSTVDGAEAAPTTDVGESLDDVPLLSEVLSRRSYSQGPAASGVPGVLVALLLVAAVVTAAAVWFFVL